MVQLPASDSKNGTVGADILMVSQLADPGARSFEAEARLPDESSLRSGEFVLVDVPTAVRSEALFVPGEALLRRTALASVFRLGTDGTLEQIEVAAGILKDGAVEIRGPLAAGDNIVVSSHQTLRDGIRVTIAKQGSAGETVNKAPESAAQNR